MALSLNTSLVSNMASNVFYHPTEVQTTRMFGEYSASIRYYHDVQIYGGTRPTEAQFTNHPDNNYGWRSNPYYNSSHLVSWGGNTEYIGTSYSKYSAAPYPAKWMMSSGHVMLDGDGIVYNKESYLYPKQPTRTGIATWIAFFTWQIFNPSGTSTYWRDYCAVQSFVLADVGPIGSGADFELDNVNLVAGDGSQVSFSTDPVIRIPSA